MSRLFTSLGACARLALSSGPMATGSAAAPVGLAGAKADTSRTVTLVRRDGGGGFGGPRMGGGPRMSAPRMSAPRMAAPRMNSPRTGGMRAYRGPRVRSGTVPRMTGVNRHRGHRHHGHHRRGPRFYGFYGAPFIYDDFYYNNSYYDPDDDCYYSRKYRRWVCPDVDY
jgi:hypothetical protein